MLKDRESLVRRVCDRDRNRGPINSTFNEVSPVYNCNYRDLLVRSMNPGLPLTRRANVIGINIRERF